MKRILKSFPLFQIGKENVENRRREFFPNEEPWVSPDEKLKEIRCLQRPTRSENSNFSRGQAKESDKRQSSETSFLNQELAWYFQTQNPGAVASEDKGSSPRNGRPRRPWPLFAFTLQFRVWFVWGLQEATNNPSGSLHPIFGFCNR